MNQKKNDPTIRYLLETPFKYKETYRLEINAWREIHHVNTNEKKVEVAILILRQNRLQSKESFQG